MYRQNVWRVHLAHVPHISLTPLGFVFQRRQAKISICNEKKCENFGSIIDEILFGVPLNGLTVQRRIKKGDRINGTRKLHPYALCNLIPLLLMAEINYFHLSWIKVGGGHDTINSSFICLLQLNLQRTDAINLVSPKMQMLSDQSHFSAPFGGVIYKKLFTYMSHLVQCNTIPFWSILVAFQLNFRHIL